VPSTTATDGSTIEYEVHGDGPTLLLVPGLGFGPWSFFKQVPALSRRFRTVTFDLRAPRDRDHGITELARDAAALLDRLGTGRAHVLGTSLGGFVAQELALARPDLVDRLVLISTSYGGRGGERMSARALAAMFGVGSFSPEGAVRRGLKATTSARYRAEEPGEFERIVGDRLAFSPSLSSYLRQAGAGANFDASGRVRDIEAPTLVIHGSEDRLVPVANARALARAVPRSRLRVLEGAGHLVFIEEAEEVNEEVASFLLGVEEVRVARQSHVTGGKLEGLLWRRLPGHARRLASKLGELLTR
jgi:pimeloyl-ACP methyl ester carboxylesterase